MRRLDSVPLGSAPVGVAMRLLLALAWPGAAAAQEGRDSVSVIPGERYRHNGLHRFLLGSTYRKLWATSIKVPVLDLATFEGGLVATETGGRKQTQSLRFKTPDGRVFVFRALDKDPTKAWPELLRRTPARNFAEDQTSGLFPTGALAVGVLEEAAGLLHPDQELVYLPNDPRLGEWRDEFKNLVGLFEERVRGEGNAIESIPGASEVVSSEKLFERLVESGANRIDDRAYLTARLFDLFVGDWDRHADQWNWARFDQGDVHRWQPIPRDRDWALSRLDGPLYAVVRLFQPQFQNFGAHYGSIYGLTLSGQPLDRRLLSRLELPVWDSVVRELQSRLTDSVIARAVEALPKEFGVGALSRLGRELQSRRDHLGSAAHRFYRHLAGEIDLWGSNDAEVATLTREPEGDLLVSLARKGEPVAQRRLDADETGELRLYLFGGPDTVRFEGSGPDRIKVRLVPGGGDNLVVDSTGYGPARVYDDSSTTAVAATGSIGRSHRPTPSTIDPTSPLAIHRDWGSIAGAAPWIEYGPEIGLVIGGGPVLTRFGFRKVPYQSRLAARVAYATGAAGLNADLTADFRFEDPTVRLVIRAATLNTEIQRYFGLGNTSPEPSDTRLNRVLSREYRLDPSLEKRIGQTATIGFGATLRSSTSDLTTPSLLATERPYGSGQFTEAGAFVTAGVDTRDHPVYPTRGVVIQARASVFPKVFDVEQTFAVAAVGASTYLTARGVPATPTLALRAGAEKAWNPTPFFELPSIGGRRSVRGLPTRRFLGDRAAYGSAEIRLDLGGFELVAPGTWGLYGLADAGRVALAGQSSDRWHTAVGGGLWFAFIDRRTTMTVTYASSEERGLWYVRGGFHF